MALGRAAKGLPRYYMDVGWYRARRFLGLPVEALFLFEAIVGHCNGHATDGRVPADVEDLAAVLGLRVSVVRKGLKRLVEVRYEDVGPPLRAVGDELVVAGWEDHNPTAAETEAYYAGKSAAGSFGNHKRWHVDRGIVDPDCDHCRDRTSDTPAIAEPSHGMGWDGTTTPQPPAERGATSHPPAEGGPHLNCRQCGTNRRGRPDLAPPTPDGPRPWLQPVEDPDELAARLQVVPPPPLPADHPLAARARAAGGAA